MRRIATGLMFAILPFTAHAQERCPEYSAAERVGTINDSDLTEASGLAFSQRNSNLFYSHNDSGAGSTLRVYETSGSFVAAWNVPGSTSRDWEAMASGPCAEGEAPCLYVGDIGDNDLRREFGVVFRFEEPEDPTFGGDTARAESLVFHYPDGPQDAETLLVHPQTGDIFIVSKVIAGSSKLYRFPTPLQPGIDVELELLAEHTFGMLPLSEQSTTDGAFSPDGTRMVIRAYGKAYEFAVVSDMTTVFEGEFTTIRLGDERQGEAITYDPAGNALWSTSEGVPSPIHRYTCLEGTGEDVEPNSDTGLEPNPEPGPEPEKTSEDCACTARRPAVPSLASLLLWSLLYGWMLKAKRTSSRT